MVVGYRYYRIPEYWRKMCTTQPHQRFIVTNVFVKDDFNNHNVPKSAFYKISPVDNSLITNNTQCPIVYAGSPMPTNYGTLTKESNDARMSVSDSGNLPSNSQDSQEIKPSQLFDISEAMEGFIPQDVDQECKNKVSSKKIDPLVLLQNSTSLVVDNTALPYTVRDPYFSYQKPQQYFPQLNKPLQKTFMQIPQGNSNTGYKFVLKDAANPGILRNMAHVQSRSAMLKHGSVIKIPVSTLNSNRATHSPTIKLGNKLKTVTPSFYAPQKRSPILSKPVYKSPPLLNKPRTIISKPHSLPVLSTSKPMLIKLVDANNVKFNLTKTISNNSAPIKFQQMPLHVTTAPITTTIKSPETILNSAVNNSKPTTVSIESQYVSTVPKATITKISTSTPKTVHCLKRKFAFKFADELVPSFKKPLRTGIEITFEDGIRHFITNINELLTLDDEHIKKWTDIKKGSTLVAKWTDGLFYDAKVVECYFDSLQRKKLEPEKQLAKENKDKDVPVPVAPKPTSAATTSKKQAPEVSKPAKKKNFSQAIMCEKCKLVFMKIKAFRKHQKSCKSSGQTVNIDDCKINLVDFNITTKKVELKDGKDFKAPKDLKGDYILTEGTKILHRWELSDSKNASRWYCGTILKVNGPDLNSIDCEFEVEYSGEESHGAYKLRLYEDYPADIRIVS